MRINDFIKSWKVLVNRLNDKGIPLPMVRDPDTGEGSVSLALVVISAAIVVVGMIGKAAGFLGGIDMANAFQFFLASSTLYFGHHWVNKPSMADKEKDAKTPPADDPDAK